MLAKKIWMVYKPSMQVWGHDPALSQKAGPIGRLNQGLQINQGLQTSQPVQAWLQSLFESLKVSRLGTDPRMKTLGFRTHA